MTNPPHVFVCAQKQLNHFSHWKIRYFEILRKAFIKALMYFRHKLVITSSTNKLIILELILFKMPFLNQGNIQLWNFDYIRILNKPYVNEITLSGQNPP